MRRKNSRFVVLAFGALACSHAADEHAPEDEHSTPVAQPLIGGRDLSDVEAARSPAVSIELPQAADPDNPDKKNFGSGMLIAESTVLTAGHNFARGPLISKILVRQGFLPTGRTSGVVGVPRLHPHFMVRLVPRLLPDGTPQIGGDGKPVTDIVTSGPDLGILRLATNIGRSPVVIPGLDCAAPAPPEVLCVSGNDHTLVPLLPGIQFLFDPGVINDAKFKLVFANGKPVRRSNKEVLFDSNFGILGFGAQAVEEGDSGSGCLDTQTQKLSMVVATKKGDDSPALQGSGVLLSDSSVSYQHCDWINAQLQSQTAAVYQDDVDADALADTFILRQVLGDDFALDIDRSSLSPQSFAVNIPGAPNIAAMTVGNFTGGGQALLLIEDGSLLTARFNNGPIPALNGAPSNDYVQVASARMNSGTIDDLVAQRSDGTLDVFLGGAGGLQLAPDIHPIALQLDRDGRPDFVWIAGPARINSTSSLNREQSTRLTIPDTLRLDFIRAGRVRRVEGLNEGIDDIIAFGKDEAGGGVVVWCPSNGNGVECKPAIEARFATPARNPRNIDVKDVNLDGLDDVVVFYEGSDDPKTILSTPTGFRFPQPNNPPARSFDDVAIASGAGLIATLGFEDVAGNTVVTVMDPDMNEVQTINSGAPSGTPFSVALGNFNGDGSLPASATALEAGELPFQDVAVLSGGQIFVLMSNGDGTFSLVTPNEPSGFTSISVSDVNGDGLDDLEGVRADGSVTAFAGSATSSGLEVAGQNFTGLPTPNGSDGKMLLLSGLGVDTVGATEARIKLAVGAGDTAALSKLTVQVFDGNNGGLHQFEEQTNLLKTCYRLSADPCGDSVAGNCSGGALPPVELLTVSSDVLGDDVWDTIYDGPHSPAASLTGSDTGPFTYSLRVFLSEDCSVPPGPGATLSVATADAFKIRSNAMVSQPAGEFSFVGSDSSGPLGVPSLPYMTDKAYDGIFRLPIAVGASAREIQLKEADADDLDDGTSGVSLGANSEIQYRLLRPDGSAAPLVGAENATPTAVVTNASGNNDGLTNLDVETRIHSFTTATPGTWLWEWSGVKATNAVHVFAPFGSPTTHEILGAYRLRPTNTTIEQPYFWDDNQAALAENLPVVLGYERPDGSLEGRSIRVSTLTEARDILDNPTLTVQGELQKQLLLVKLNSKRSRSLGEDINGALVYGITASVRTTLRLADDAVSGLDVFADEPVMERLVNRLSSVNLGETTYRQPGVPFPEHPMADDDADGILNLKDNCPVVANPFQEDSDDDLIGDACNVRPVVECVLERAPDVFEAYFGYENVLSFRSIPLGLRNNLIRNDGAVLDAEQPTEFASGRLAAAFRATFTRGQSLRWTLEDETVSVAADAPRCSGKELTKVDFAPQVALLGTDSVLIGDHVSIRAPVGVASVVSGGDVVLGAKAAVGNVFSAARTLMGRYSAVAGAAVSADDVELQPGAVVRGPLLEAAVLRPHSLSWLIGSAQTVRPEVELHSGQQLRLEPGTYGALTVGPGAQLVLEAGNYRVESLDVDRQGTVILRSGEVVVHVAAALSHRGETRLAESDARLILGYFGTNAAAIESSMQGTLVAPNALVVLGTVPGSWYTGAFFAKRLEVRADSLVMFDN